MLRSAEAHARKKEESALAAGCPTPVTMTLPDFSNNTVLGKLESFLKDKSYIHGYVFLSAAWRAG